MLYFKAMVCLACLVSNDSNRFKSDTSSGKKKVKKVCFHLHTYTNTTTIILPTTLLLSNSSSDHYNDIASAVLGKYNSLPNKGKPIRSKDLNQWTVLAGFCFCNNSTKEIDCVSLGFVGAFLLCPPLLILAWSLPYRTGLKVLPHAKLPLQGDVLHDSHAEIIARRGLKLYLFNQLASALTEEESILSRAVGKDGDQDKEGWRLKEGLFLAMYISILPCQSTTSLVLIPASRAYTLSEIGGDASTYSLSLVTPPTPPLLAATASSSYNLLTFFSALSLATTSPAPSSSITPLPSTARISVRRGRTSFHSSTTLRTKPGRLDSLPSTSHSCSDKMALWNSGGGIQGALLSALGVDKIQIHVLVVGDVELGQREKVEEEVQRALNGRLGTSAIGVLDVGFTESQFDGGRRDGTGVVSCPESCVSLFPTPWEVQSDNHWTIFIYLGISYVKNAGTEVIVNGIRQGASLKRKGNLPLGPKSRYDYFFCTPVY